MDITFIAGAAVPYLVKGAEAFSKTAGEKAADKIGELYCAVKSKFKGDSYAEQTLTRIEEHPELENRRAMLKEILVEKMSNDKEFASLICQIVDSLKSNEKGDQVIGISTGDISNSKIIIGDNNKIIGK